MTRMTVESGAAVRVLEPSPSAWSLRPQTGRLLLELIETTATASTARPTATADTAPTATTATVSAA